MFLGINYEILGPLPMILSYLYARLYDLKLLAVRIILLGSGIIRAAGKKRKLTRSEAVQLGCYNGRALINNVEVTNIG